MVDAASKTDKKVNSILANLKKTKKHEPSSEVLDVEKKAKVKTVSDVKVSDVPRGRPKSGRIWKTQKQRFSSIKKTKGAHQTFAEKTKLRLQLKEIKEASKEIQIERKNKKEALKERRRVNMKKAEERRLKSEIVQVISNSAKIKRMKKKQLRFIEKRDTATVSK